MRLSLLPFFAIAGLSTLPCESYAQISSDKVCILPDEDGAAQSPTTRYLNELVKGEISEPLSLTTGPINQAPDLFSEGLDCAQIQNGELPVHLMKQQKSGQTIPHVHAEHIVSLCSVGVAMRALLTWPEDQIEDKSYGIEGSNGPCASSISSARTKSICTAITSKRLELEATFGESSSSGAPFWMDFPPKKKPLLALDKVIAGATPKLEPGGIRKLLSDDVVIKCDQDTLTKPETDSDDSNEKSDGFNVGIAIAKNLSGLRQDTKYKKNDRSKSSYAELSASLDNEDREEIKDDEGNIIEKRPTEKVSFNGAIGNPMYFENIAPLGPTDLLLTPYIELQYKEREDASKETDNLFIGTEFAFALDDGAWKGPNLYPRFNFAYVTDIEERDSEQYIASAEINIPYAERLADTSIPILRNYAKDASLHKFGDLNLTLGWDVDAIVDYSEVGERGDKVRLFDYTRVGYGANATFRLFSDPDGEDQPGDDNWSIEFDVDYDYRDVVSGDAIDSDFVTLALSYKPASDKNVSYGLTYKRGENTISLEDVENWELGFKLRR